MLRPNYSEVVFTRVDEISKRKLDNIAISKKQKTSELLRDIIMNFIDKSEQMAGLLPVVEGEGVGNG